MAQNEYDEIVTGQGPAVANEYDAIVVDMEAHRKTQLRASIHEAVQSNPDQYAKARGLSKQTGIPAPVVERNLPTVERRAKVNEYDKLLEDSPLLAQFMASPEFAKLAHDDLANMNIAERAARNVYAGFGPRVAVGLYGLGQAAAEGLASDIDRFLVRPRILPANPMVDAANFFRRKRQEQEFTAERATADTMADAGRFERGVYSGLQSAGQNIPALIAATCLMHGPPCKNQTLQHYVIIRLQSPFSPVRIL